jgi:hypothetical protein
MELPVVVVALVGAAVLALLARGRQAALQREPMLVRVDDEPLPPRR